jgi:hypothetical protein
MPWVEEGQFGYNLQSAKDKAKWNLHRWAKIQWSALPAAEN